MDNQKMDFKSKIKEHSKSKIYDGLDHFYVDGEVTLTIKDGQVYAMLDGKPMPSGSFYIIKMDNVIIRAFVYEKPGIVKLSTAKDASNHQSFEKFLEGYFGELYNFGEKNKGELYG